MSEHDDLETIREQRRQELLKAADEAGQIEASGDMTAGGAPDEPIHVESEVAFREIVNEYGVVLVDFYADWCGPCQMLEPIVEVVATSTPAAVAKVDTDALPSLAAEHGVRGVPTLVVYAGGEVAEQLVGVQDEATLRSVIDRVAP